MTDLSARNRTALLRLNVRLAELEEENKAMRARLEALEVPAISVLDSRKRPYIRKPAA